MPFRTTPIADTIILIRTALDITVYSKQGSHPSHHIREAKYLRFSTSLAQLRTFFHRFPVTLPNRLRVVFQRGLLFFSLAHWTVAKIVSCRWSLVHEPNKKKKYKIKQSLPCLSQSSSSQSFVKIVQLKKLLFFNALDWRVIFPILKTLLKVLESKM